MTSNMKLNLKPNTNDMLPEIMHCQKHNITHNIQTHKIYKEDMGNAQNVWTDTKSIDLYMNNVSMHIGVLHGGPVHRI